jgi:glycosyltransferase involved in cell wall biosynthesis
VRIALLAHAHHPIAEPYRGGLEMHTALLADGLVARGHDVTLHAKAGSRTRARLRPLVGAGFVHGPAAPGRPRPDDVLDAAMWSAIADLGPVDVVLNNSLSPVPYVAMDQLPVFTVLHTPATLARVNAVLEAPGWRPGERHVWAAVSQVTTQDWRRLLPEVATVPNGIDLTHWAPRPGRGDHPVGRQARHAVWTGRITPEKGLPLAIDAVRRAGWQLSIAGPVSDPEHFARDVVPRLGEDVRYRGHLGHDDLPAFLRSGTVYLFSPLWPEPFGLALLEALACGTPAAALPTGAVREIVGPQGGVVAADCTAEALAAALVEAARLDRAEVAASVAHLDRAVMLDSYEAVLHRLVGAEPARALDGLAELDYA